jgi:hypothetical protein
MRQKAGDWKQRVADGGEAFECTYDEYAPSGGNDRQIEVVLDAGIYGLLGLTPGKVAAGRGYRLRARPR